jgi:hypothetical protein
MLYACACVAVLAGLSPDGAYGYLRLMLWNTETWQIHDVHGSVAHVNLVRSVLTI